jgi:hypothetical protein
MNFSSRPDDLLNSMPPGREIGRHRRTPKSGPIGFFRRALFIRRAATPSHGREGETA